MLFQLYEILLALRRGLSTYESKLTIEAVANDLNLPYTSMDTLLKIQSKN
ncbi:hypothetical protein [Enterococcus pallens]|nr:hypothetical protein [Enterococcus pallens]OJG77572.1 hypothetical protein RV10_GL002406 [Enterococcus pallens]